MRVVRLAVLVPFGVLMAQSGPEHYRAGRAAMVVNDADAAAAAFERAIAAEPNRAEYHLWMARAVGTQAINAGTIRQAFLAKRAKNEFEKTVQLDPANVGGREGMMQFYVFAPAMFGGSMAKARGEADAIAAVNPMRGHFAHAMIAQREKDQGTYEREVRAAYAENPDSASALSSLTTMLLGSKRADEAASTVERFVARHPADLTALLWMGRVAVATGRQLDKGEQALRAVLASPQLGADGMPSAPTAHFRLGELLAKRGANADAKREYETALQLNPRLNAAKKALADLKS